MTSALTINRTLEFMNRWLHGLSFPIQVCGSRSISDARFWTFLRAIHILGMGPKSTHELHLWFLYPYTTTLNALLYAILNNFVHKTKFGYIRSSMNFHTWHHVWGQKVSDFDLGVVAYLCNPSTLRVEARGLRV
jgi:hypothetical protein